MILYEKEVLNFLNLPAIPKREWDGKSSFKVGVAIVDLQYGGQAYAVATFDAESNTKPRVKKVFGMDWFTDIVSVFVVPSYMDSDVENMDLDDESKKKAKEILKEAAEIENEGVEVNDELSKPKNEYYFDAVHNDEEARAFIQSYNSRNHIKGRIPTTHEGLVMRLAVIYSEQNKKKK